MNLGAGNTARLRMFPGVSLDIVHGDKRCETRKGGEICPQNKESRAFVRKSRVGGR